MPDDARSRPAPWSAQWWLRFVGACLAATALATALDVVLIGDSFAGALTLSAVVMPTCLFLFVFNEWRKDGRSANPS
jgi:hypothetical protein